MKTIQVQCPDAVADALDRLVREGWVSSPQDAIVEALRRFLESRRPELIKDQIRRDIDWGLHGRD